jgi:hypothetical protein
MSDYIYRVHDVLDKESTYHKSLESALKRAHKQADGFESAAGKKLTDREIDPNVEVNIWWSDHCGEVIIIEKVFVND